MNIKKTEMEENNAIKFIGSVIFSVTDKEMREFTEALKVVEQFNEKARKSLKIMEEHADWTMYEYKVFPENKAIKVKIEQGACG